MEVGETGEQRSPTAVLKAAVQEQKHKEGLEENKVRKVRTIHGDIVNLPFEVDGKDNITSLEIQGKLELGSIFKVKNTGTKEFYYRAVSDNMLPPNERMAMLNTFKEFPDAVIVKQIGEGEAKKFAESGNQVLNIQDLKLTDSIRGKLKL